MTGIIGHSEQVLSKLQPKVKLRNSNKTPMVSKSYFAEEMKKLDDYTVAEKSLLETIAKHKE